MSTLSSPRPVRQQPAVIPRKPLVKPEVLAPGEAADRVGWRWSRTCSLIVPNSTFSCCVYVQLVGGHK